ncbi:MAG: PmoA family protein [Verrucomicrobia bacterium]|nr:PmoA family protein [Verrucomicrobiota bacterium]
MKHRTSPSRRTRIPFLVSDVPAVFAAILLASAGAVPAADAAKPLSVSTDRAAGLLRVSYGGQPLLVYAHAPGQFKPYVKELYTLRGDNVLLDAPADHLHHHGLMYAVTVNGVNFWEEATNPGYQRSARPPEAAVTIRPDGSPQAVIHHRLFWVARTNAALANPEPAALLVEQRTLMVSVQAAAEEVALHWRSEFSVGPGTSRAVLSGSDYHGLGIRFPRSWDRVARHTNSAGAAYPTQGRHDVLEARWGAVAATLAGRPQTLAVFAHPGHAGPSKFFSMLDPFAYLSATQGLESKTLEYTAGSPWRLDYLVTVYPALRTPETIEAGYRAWLKQR